LEEWEFMMALGNLGGYMDEFAVHILPQISPHAHGNFA
jgi:hypothetical protein